MFFGGKQNKELDVFAKLLVDGITNMFQERGEIQFSQDPDVERKNIIEYNGRMRAEGMEKFNNPTYVSAINYYLNQKEMERHKAVGTIVVYVEQEYVARIMRLLKYPTVDDEDEEALKDSCGTLCNILAGRFKSEISAKGYVDLEMSHFSSYRNNIPYGAEFCYDEYDKYEVAFYIEKEKRLVVEMTIGRVPHR